MTLGSLFDNLWHSCLSVKWNWCPLMVGIEENVHRLMCGTFLRVKHLCVVIFPSVDLNYPTVPTVGIRRRGWRFVGSWRVAVPQTWDLALSSLLASAFPHGNWPHHRVIIMAEQSKISPNRHLLLQSWLPWVLSHSLKADPSVPCPFILRRRARFAYILLPSSELLTLSSFPIAICKTFCLRVISWKGIFNIMGRFCS